MTMPLFTGFAIDGHLLVNAALTAAIETPLFRLCGYRHPLCWLLFALVNVVSNLLLNECLRTLQENTHHDSLVALCELAVVLLEFALCRYFVVGSAPRLLLVVLLTNVVSYLAGLWLYSHAWLPV